VSGPSRDGGLAIVVGMCRSIKTLRQADVIATDEEIRAAARQFVRKVSGFREPSSRHEKAFEGAVDEIALASQRLLDSIAGNLAGSRAS
jgi:hypothetical protein